MRRLFVVLVTVLIAALSAGCASTMTVIVKDTTAAINTVPTLQCGQPTAPPAPACLTPAQYLKVNQDLLAASDAELAYSQIQSGIASAKGQTLAQAAATIVSSLSSALADIMAGVQSISNTAANNLSAAIAKAVGKL